MSSSELRQKKYWEGEHLQNNPDIPSIASEKPSLVILRFLDFLKEKNVDISGTVVDIGCGKGRNAIFLARQGLKVNCLDFINSALREIENRAKKENISKFIQTKNCYISEKWDFPDNYFDFAIDCYGTIDIESSLGRRTCINEMFRCLKPGAFAAVAAVAADDSYESLSIDVIPTQEANCVIWTKNNKFQKNYTLNEIENTYKNFFLWEISKVQKETVKMGEHRVSKDFFIFLQKPE